MGRFTIHSNINSIAVEDAERLKQIVKDYQCTNEYIIKWQAAIDKDASFFECDIKAYCDSVDALAKELNEVFTAIGIEVTSAKMDAYIDFMASPPPKGIYIIDRGGFYVVMLKEGKSFYEDIPYS